MDRSFFKFAAIGFTIGLIWSMKKLFEVEHKKEITQELLNNNELHLVIDKPSNWILTENVIGCISIIANDIDIDLNQHEFQRHYDFQYGINIHNSSRLLTGIKIHDGIIYDLSPPKTSIEEMFQIKRENTTLFSLLPTEIIIFIYNFMRNGNLVAEKFTTEKFKSVAGVKVDNAVVRFMNVNFFTVKLILILYVQLVAHIVILLYHHPMFNKNVFHS